MIKSETRTHKIKLIDDIIWAETKTEFVEPFKKIHAEELYAKVKSMTKGEQYFLILIAKNGKIEAEARNFIKKNLQQVNKFAIVTTNHMTNFMGNLFLGLHKLEVPIKLFSNENDALEWIKRRD